MASMSPGASTCMDTCLAGTSPQAVAHVPCMASACVATHLGDCPTGSSPQTAVSVPCMGMDRRPCIDSALALVPSSMSDTATTLGSASAAALSPVSLPAPVPWLPAKAIPIASVDNEHTRRMQGKVGFHLPVDKLNLLASALSPLPKAYQSALADPN
jgi:hypothetical protein